MYEFGVLDIITFMTYITQRFLFIRVLSVSGLHALVDLLSQPTHLLLANQRRVEVVAVAAQGILV